MRWQSFCHVSAAAAVPFWPDSQPVNSRELRALQRGKKTSNAFEIGP